MKDADSASEATSDLFVAVRVPGYRRRFLLAMLAAIIINVAPLYFTPRMSDGTQYCGWPFAAIQRTGPQLDFTLDSLSLIGDIVLALVVCHLFAKCLKNG